MHQVQPYLCLRNPKKEELPYSDRMPGWLEKKIIRHLFIIVEIVNQVVQRDIRGLLSQLKKSRPRRIGLPGRQVKYVLRGMASFQN